MNAFTPPWLSCYVDGNEQRLHTDAPHGPWAFVLSLTPDEVVSAMGGGETQVMCPGALDFWRGFGGGYALEEADLFTLVEPSFGRVLAFDPRLPHGVRQVRGPRGMAAGRLVLHGWFSEPGPFFRGGLASGEGGAVEAAAAVLDRALAAAMEGLDQAGRVTGCLSARVTVCGTTGEVTSVEALADSLVADPEDWQGSIGTTENGETVRPQGSIGERGAALRGIMVTYRPWRAHLTHASFVWHFHRPAGPRLEDLRGRAGGRAACLERRPLHRRVPHCVGERRHPDHSALHLQMTNEEAGLLREEFAGLTIHNATNACWQAVLNRGTRAYEAIHPTHIKATLHKGRWFMLLYVQPGRLSGV